MPWDEMLLSLEAASAVEDETSTSGVAALLGELIAVLTGG